MQNQCYSAIFLNFLPKQRQLTLAFTAILMMQLQNWCRRVESIFERFQALGNFFKESNLPVSKDDS